MTIENTATSVGKKVLLDEAQSILNLLENFQDENFEKACEIILNTPGKLIFIGLGKTGHISAKLSATFSSTGTPSFCIHSTESNHGDLGGIQPESDTLVFISQSGESFESFNTIRFAKENNMRIITLSNKENSTLARLGGVNLRNFVSSEACPLGLAPTSSTTAFLALGDALAAAVMTLKGFTANDFADSHPDGALGRNKLKAGSEKLMKPLPIVTQSDTIEHIIKVMNSHRLGCAVVVNEDQTLAGFISSGDILRHIASNGLKAVLSNVDFNRAPLTIEHDELGVKGYNMMNIEDKSSLIVMKEGLPIGILDIKVCEHMF